MFVHRGTQTRFEKSFIFIFQDYDTKDLGEFQDIIMKGCDFNRDGKISKKELTMILLALSKQDTDT